MSVFQLWIGQRGDSMEFLHDLLRLLTTFSLTKLYSFYWTTLIYSIHVSSNFSSFFYFLLIFLFSPFKLLSLFLFYFQQYICSPCPNTYLYNLFSLYVVSFLSWYVVSIQCLSFSMCCLSYLNLSSSFCPLLIPHRLKLFVPPLNSLFVSCGF